MNKFLSIILVLLLACPLKAEFRSRILTENIGAVNTTATQINVPQDGYLIFTAVDQKIFLSLAGTTENITSYMPIYTGEKLDTETYYYASEQIAIASDSGTANYVIQVYTDTRP